MWDPEFALEKEILTDPYRSIQIHTRFWDSASEHIKSTTNARRSKLVVSADAYLKMTSQGKKRRAPEMSLGCGFGEWKEEDVVGNYPRRYRKRRPIWNEVCAVHLMPLHIRHGASPLSTETWSEAFKSDRAGSGGAWKCWPQQELEAKRFQGVDRFRHGTQKQKWIDRTRW